MTQNTQLAAYRAALSKSGYQEELVDVTVPGGFTFKFVKPPPFASATLLAMLPQSLSSPAVDAWIGSGAVKSGEAAPTDDDAQAAFGMKVLEMVVDFSRSPKIVVGMPKDDNEFSLNWLTLEDSMYLGAWIVASGNIKEAAGGGPGEMLGNFSKGTKPDTLASASKRKVRAKAK